VKEARAGARRVREEAARAETMAKRVPLDLNPTIARQQTLLEAASADSFCQGPRMVLRDIYEPNVARMPPSSSPPSVYFKGAPAFRPAASQPELPHPSSDGAEVQQEQKSQRTQPKRERAVEGEPYGLRQWLLRDEAVARCSIEQAKSLRQEEGTSVC
jgi:hypothetical protein